jgi:hypothetical protein
VISNASPRTPIAISPQSIVMTLAGYVSVMIFSGMLRIFDWLRGYFGPRGFCIPRMKTTATAMAIAAPNISTDMLMACILPHRAIKNRRNTAGPRTPDRFRW